MKKLANLQKATRKRAKPKKGKKVADVLTPRDVELLRDLYESGFWTVEALADKFEITVSRCQNLVWYKIQC